MARASKTTDRWQRWRPRILATAGTWMRLLYQNLLHGDFDNSNLDSNNGDLRPTASVLFMRCHILCLNQGPHIARSRLCLLPSLAIVVVFVLVVISSSRVGGGRCPMRSPGAVPVIVYT